MIDDLMSLKAASIGSGVSRAREGYRREPATFAADLSRQDAAILNIVRACDAALDMGQHLIHRELLGVPQSARDVFTLLNQRGWIDASMADNLKRIVGFRDIALHDGQALQRPITVAIIEKHLDEFLDYSKAVLLKDTGT